MLRFAGLAPFAAVALLAALDATWMNAAADCICRAHGREFAHGQTACLMSPKGPRLATCGMVLNNSSWEFSEAPCTVSGVAKPGALRLASRRTNTVTARAGID
jgi:hypothetical protein